MFPFKETSTLVVVEHNEFLTLLRFQATRQNEGKIHLHFVDDINDELI